MIQVWTINILVMPSHGRTEKSKNGQRHHRTKAPNDQNQGGQNPPNEKIFQDSNNQGVGSHDHMTQVWTINILVIPSRGCTEKSQNGQKHHRTKEPKDQDQGGQNPQKWENILRLQQSRCRIPWSHDTGLDNQHSCDVITWPHREKQKWTKAPQDESPKRSETRRTKFPKMRIYFKTQTIKVYDPMITWYRCGQ